jgi:GT2 family glycosyltransferase
MISQLFRFQSIDGRIATSFGGSNGWQRTPKMTESKSVTALLLNYIRWRDTADCVRSLMQCTYSPLEIVILDNGSPNESESMLRRLFPSIRIYQTGKNLGYTGGVNFGYRIILDEKPDYVLILNPDTLVDPDFLRIMVDAMEGAPSAAACCGTVLYHSNHGRAWYAGGAMVPWRGLAVHRYSLPDVSSRQNTLPQSVSFVTGCALLQKTSTIRKIGFLDERFYMYLDDIEFSARAVRKGFALLYVPQAKIYHRVAEGEESPFKLYYSVRNRLLLINSAFTGIRRVIAGVYFVVVLALKMVFWFLAKPSFFKASRAGLYDYFTNNLGEGRGVAEFSS